MTRVAKTPQYKDFNQRHNCFGAWQEHELKIKNWRQAELPLMLEVGAGEAAISLKFIADNPNWQAIALDRKSDRLNKAARRGAESNLAFLQADFKDLLDYVDLTKQVKLLWLPFADPYPRKRQSKHRLTYIDNLNLYKSLLEPGGRIRFKTDNLNLYEYTYNVFKNDLDFKIIENHNDLLGRGYENFSLDVQTITKYERRFLDLNLPIYYLELELSRYF